MVVTQGRNHRLDRMGSVRRINRLLVTRCLLCPRLALRYRSTGPAALVK